METQSYTQRERLFYIDFLAFFTGQVTRKDLVTRFGISEPAATKDLSLYSEMALNMLEYDLRQRCYVYSGGTPLFTHQVDHALHSLSGNRAMTMNPAPVKQLPSWVQFSIKRKVPVEIAASVTRAICQRRKISVNYGSLSSGQAERVLSPVALVHDGLRWHIRGYSYNDEEFRDYNIARFTTATDCGSSEVTLDQDNAWTTEVTVMLVPHPKAKHPEAICVDYDIEGETKDVPMPKCVAPFFLRHWHVDTTPNATKNPKERHLFLKNRSALLAQGVSEWVFDEDERPNIEDK